MRPQPPQTLTRREALKLAASAALLPATLTARAGKKVIIAGGGIGGLCCGFELMRRGHDVTVLEASDRTGGHVYTVREGFDDGLYGDGGAEHFTNPGYDIYRGYVEEFKLPFVFYPRRQGILTEMQGKLYTEEMLRDPAVLRGFGLNEKEIAFLKGQRFEELASLYYKPYMDAFHDEYKPFDAGLNDLDHMTTKELFKRDGASEGALKLIGGGGSALQSVWHAAILKLRGVPLYPPKVYRLVGGNQKLPDAFTERLGTRVKLNSPVAAIEHSPGGVKVTCKGPQGTATYEGDYLVCAMSAWMLRQIPVTPALPAAKAYAIQNVPYYSNTRLLFQSKSKFWLKDNISPNMEFEDPSLFQIWTSDEEVQTSHGFVAGTASGPSTVEKSLAALRKRYPGKYEDIQPEKSKAVVWATDPWRSACERTDYAPGTLSKFWPGLIEPHGRIHFCGAYADNLNWGQEAATRSANRVAKAIDAA
jgi:monoamine oxidase